MTTTPINGLNNNRPYNPANQQSAEATQINIYEKVKDIPKLVDDKKYDEALDLCDKFISKSGTSFLNEPFDIESLKISGLYLLKANLNMIITKASILISKSQSEKDRLNMSEYENNIKNAQDTINSIIQYASNLEKIPGYTNFKSENHHADLRESYKLNLAFLQLRIYEASNQVDKALAISKYISSGNNKTQTDGYNIFTSFDPKIFLVGVEIIDSKMALIRCLINKYESLEDSLKKSAEGAELKNEIKQKMDIFEKFFTPLALNSVLGATHLRNYLSLKLNIANVFKDTNNIIKYADITIKQNGTNALSLCKDLFNVVQKDENLYYDFPVNMDQGSKEGAKITKGFALLNAEMKKELGEFIRTLDTEAANNKEASPSYLLDLLNLKMYYSQGKNTQEGNMETTDVASFLLDQYSPNVPNYARAIPQSSIPSKFIENAIICKGNALIANKNLQNTETFLNAADKIIENNKGNFSDKFYKDYLLMNMVFYADKKEYTTVKNIAKFLLGETNNSNLPSRLQGIKAPVLSPVDKADALLQLSYALQNLKETQQAYEYTKVALSQVSQVSTNNSDTNVNDKLPKVEDSLTVAVKAICLLADLEMESTSLGYSNIIRLKNIVSNPNSSLVETIKSTKTTNKDKLEFIDQIYVTIANYYMQQNNPKEVEKYLGLMPSKNPKYPTLSENPKVEYKDHPSILLANGNYQLLLKNADEAAKIFDQAYKNMKTTTSTLIVDRQVEFFTELGVIRAASLNSRAAKNPLNINENLKIDLDEITPKYRRTYREFLIINALEIEDYTAAKTNVGDFYKNAEKDKDNYIDLLENGKDLKVEIYKGFFLNGLDNHKESIELFSELLKQENPELSAFVLNPKANAKPSSEISLTMSYVDIVNGFIISRLSAKEEIDPSLIDTLFSNVKIDFSEAEIINKIANKETTPLTEKEISEQYFYQKKLSLKIDAYYNAGYFEKALDLLNKYDRATNKLEFNDKDLLKFQLLTANLYAILTDSAKAKDIVKDIEYFSDKNEQSIVSVPTIQGNLQKSIEILALETKFNIGLLSNNINNLDDLINKYLMTVIDDKGILKLEKLTVKELTRIFRLYANYIIKTKQNDKLQECQKIISNAKENKFEKNDWLTLLIKGLLSSTTTDDKKNGSESTKIIDRVSLTTYFMLGDKDSVEAITNATINQIKNIDESFKASVQELSMNGVIVSIENLRKAQQNKDALKKLDENISDTNKQPDSLSKKSDLYRLNMMKAQILIEQENYDAADSILDLIKKDYVKLASTHVSNINMINVELEKYKIAILQSKKYNSPVDLINTLSEVDKKAFNFRLSLLKIQDKIKNNSFSASDLAVIQKEYDGLIQIHKLEFSDEINQLRLIINPKNEEKASADLVVPQNYNQVIDLLINKSENNPVVIDSLEKILNYLDTLTGYDFLKARISLCLFTYYFYDKNDASKADTYKNRLSSLTNENYPKMPEKFKQILARLYRDKTSDNFPQPIKAKQPLRPNLVFNPFNKSIILMTNGRIVGDQSNLYVSPVSLFTTEQSAAIKETFDVAKGKVEISADLISSYLHDQKFDNIKMSADEIAITYADGTKRTISNPFGKSGLAAADIKWITELAGLSIQLSASGATSVSSDKDTHMADYGKLTKKAELAASIGKFFKSTGTNLIFSFAYRPVDNELAGMSMENLDSIKDVGKESTAQIFLGQNVGDRFKLESIIRLETPHTSDNPNAQEKDSLMEKFAVVYKDIDTGIARLFVTNVSSEDITRTGKIVDNKTILGAEYIKAISDKFNIYVQASYTDASVESQTGTGLFAGFSYKVNDEMSVGGEAYVYSPSKDTANVGTMYSLDVYARYKSNLEELLLSKEQIGTDKKQLLKAGISETDINKLLKIGLIVNYNNGFLIVNDSKFSKLAKNVPENVLVSLKKVYFENKLFVYADKLNIDEDQKTKLVGTISSVFSKKNNMKLALIDDYYHNLFSRIDLTLQTQLQAISEKAAGVSDVLSAGVSLQSYFNLMGANFVAGISADYSAIADNSAILPSIYAKYSKQLSPKNELIIEAGADPFLIFMDAYIKHDIGNPGGWYSSFGTYTGLSYKYDSNKKEASVGISWTKGLTGKDTQTFHGGEGKEVILPIWALPLAPIIMPFYIRNIKNPGVYEIMDDGTLMAYNPDTHNYQLWIPDKNSEEYKEWEKGLELINKPIMDLQTKHGSFSSSYLLTIFKNNDTQKQEFVNYLISKGWIIETSKSNFKFTVSEETIQAELPVKYANYKEVIIHLMKRTNQNVDIFFREASINNIFAPEKTEQKQVLAELLNLISKYKTKMVKPGIAVEPSIDIPKGLEALGYLNAIYLNDDNYNGFVEDTIHISTKVLKALADKLKGKNGVESDIILLKHIREEFCNKYTRRTSDGELSMEDLKKKLSNSIKPEEKKLASLLDDTAKNGLEFIIDAGVLNEDILIDKTKTNGLNELLTFLNDQTTKYPDIVKNLVFKIDSQFLAYFFTKLDDEHYTIQFPFQLLDNIITDKDKDKKELSPPLKKLASRIELFQAYNKERMAAEKGTSLDIEVQILPNETISSGFDNDKLKTYEMNLLVTGPIKDINPNKKNITPYGKGSQVYKLMFDISKTNPEEMISFMDSYGKTKTLSDLIENGSIEHKALAAVLYGGRTKVPSILTKMLNDIKKRYGIIDHK